MAHTQSTTDLQRVQTLRQIIQPVEDLAAKAGVQFDTIIKPAKIPGQPDRFCLSATLPAGELQAFETDRAEMTEGYAQYLEAYSAKLLKLATKLRETFPAVK